MEAASIKSTILRKPWMKIRKYNSFRLKSDRLKMNIWYIPLFAAKSRGSSPNLFSEWISAPLSMSNFVTSSLPKEKIWNQNGLKCNKLSGGQTSLPPCQRNPWQNSPNFAASCNGVLLSLFRLCTLPPLCISNFAIL